MGEGSLRQRSGGRGVNLSLQDVSNFQFKTTHSGCWWRTGLGGRQLFHPPTPPTQRQSVWCWVDISEKRRGPTRLAGAGAGAVQAAGQNVAGPWALPLS